MAVSARQHTNNGEMGWESSGRIPVLTSTQVGSEWVVLAGGSWLARPAVGGCRRVS